MLSKRGSPLQVLAPEERLKHLISYSNAVEVDPSVPPKRYYRSGVEMVRMAKSYLEEGSLENAYILYMKFMILFIEKIRKHPEFASVPSGMKVENQMQLRQILPKAEELKKRLLIQYTKEYNLFLEQKNQRERELARQKSQKRLDSIVKIPSSKQSRVGEVTVVAPNLDNISYPEDYEEATSSHGCSEIEQSRPSIDRSVKPSSLMSSNLRIGLRTVKIPAKVMPMFLLLAQKNTMSNVETCGILAGKLEKHSLIITHMILPKQKGTYDSCTTVNEEEMFDYQDNNNLITIGWIHTHPTQTAFLSSVDLHTHCSYQLLMPEAIAVVCAPKYNETGFFILTPEYGLEFIQNCKSRGFHPHPTDPPLFMTADHVKVDQTAPLEVLDLR
ncbi:STAM-binding protein-like A [Onthophagus taurus]|uniref:STAM-binding protein-like A n=1 Tax=Onthophagus taurus TaxID=166361 RepID=UPI000C20E7F8|nr:STAM-binding protein-like A [Onthophagus taurus]